MKIVLVCAVALIASVLAGCFESAWHSGVDEYFERTNRILDVRSNGVSWSLKQELRYPSRRSMRLPVPELSIGMLDFLRISECELQRLVGERNSALGKVMVDSQLVTYSLRFIELAEECLAAEAVPDDLVQPLNNLVAQRRRAMPSYFWNALLAGPEFERLFSVSSREDPSDESQLPSTIEVALAQLTGFADATRAVGDIPVQEKVDPKGVEVPLQVLASTKHAGALLLMQSQLADNLIKHHELIERAWREDPVCRTNNQKLWVKPVDKDALIYVFHRYYIDEVQRKSVNLLRQSDRLVELISGLRSSVGGSSVIFDQYWQKNWIGESSAPARLRRAITEQTRFWQEVLRACELSPK